MHVYIIPFQSCELQVSNIAENVITEPPNPYYLIQEWMLKTSYLSAVTDSGSGRGGGSNSSLVQVRLSHRSHYLKVNVSSFYLSVTLISDKCQSQ